MVGLTAISGFAPYVAKYFKSMPTPQPIATIQATPTATAKPLVKTVKKTGASEAQNARINTPTPRNNTTCTIITIPCYYNNKLDSASGCTADEANASCRKYQDSYNNFNNCTTESNNMYNACKQPCDNDYQNGRVICEIAYTGSNATIAQDNTKYGECLTEVTQIWNSCSDTCLNAKISKKCY